MQEFCEGAGLPYAIFAASRGRNPNAERHDFLAALSQSSSPRADLLAGVAVTDWLQALRSIAIALTSGAAGLIVVDDVPWLVEADPEFEGALQTAWGPPSGAVADRTRPGR